MIKLRKNPNYLILAVLSVITVFTWIGLEVYNLLVKPIEINIPKDHLIPVKSDFDQKTLDELNQRLSISDQELDQVESKIINQLNISKTDSASPSAQPIPQTTVEPTPTIFIEED